MENTKFEDETETEDCARVRFYQSTLTDNQELMLWPCVMSSLMPSVHL